MNVNTKSFLSIPETGFNDLKQKISVRTTFKMSYMGHKALPWLSSYNRITIKEVFDTLCNMKTSLKYIAQQIKGGTIENFIGEEDKEFLFGKQQKGEHTLPESRKTYVISRKALDIFANISKKYNVPRGEVVEYMAFTLMLIGEKENALRLKNYRKALVFLNELREVGSSVQKSLSEVFLETNDPFFISFNTLWSDFENLIKNIEDEENNIAPHRDDK